MGKVILRTGGRRKLPRSPKKRVSKQSIQIVQAETPQAYDDAKKRRLVLAVHYGSMSQEDADKVLKVGSKRKRRTPSIVTVTRIGDLM